MAANLPEAWDESAFVDNVSRHPELFNISNEMYSNNEHRCYVFCQIGVTYNVDGEVFFCIL